MKNKNLKIGYSFYSANFLSSMWIKKKNLLHLSVAKFFWFVARFACDRIEDSSGNRFALNGIKRICHYDIISVDMYQKKHAIGWNRSSDLFQPIACFLWYTYMLCCIALLPASLFFLHNSKNRNQKNLKFDFSFYQPIPEFLILLKKIRHETSKSKKKKFSKSGQIYMKELQSAE